MWVVRVSETHICFMAGFSAIIVGKRAALPFAALAEWFGDCRSRPRSVSVGSGLLELSRQTVASTLATFSAARS